MRPAGVRDRGQGARASERREVEEAVQFSRGFVLTGPGDSSAERVGFAPSREPKAPGW